MTNPTVTVLGAGVMGELHANVVASHHGATLDTVVDLDANRARTVADQYDATATTDTDAGLSNADVCIIATPEPTHADLFERALDTECAILLEKPLAADSDDVDLMKRLWKTASTPVIPGHLLRFDPRYEDVKAAVAAGDIGDLVSLSARRAIPPAWSERMGDRIHPVKQIGTHDIDLLRWISQSPITRVRATATTQEQAGSGFPDAVHATLSFESGVSASVRLIGLWPDAFPADIDARMEAVGTDGGALVQIPAGDIQVATDRTDYPDTAYWPQVHGRVTGALRSQFDHFLDCLDGADPVVSMDDAIRAFEITEAVINATDVDGSVPVPP